MKYIYVITTEYLTIYERASRGERVIREVAVISETDKFYTYIYTRFDGTIHTMRTLKTGSKRIKVFTDKGKAMTVARDMILESTNYLLFKGA